jgi:circadian clock protein KaiA
VRAPLSIFTYLLSSPLAQSLDQYLSSDRYILVHLHSEAELLSLIDQEKQQLDCLILQDDPQLLPLVDRLHRQGTLFPLVTIKAQLNFTGQEEETIKSGAPDPTTISYQTAAVRISITQLSQIARYIDQAITQFLDLSPKAVLGDPSSMSEEITPTTTQNFLLQQQHRLTEKLKERLGYLGIYYKRNPQNFFRNFSPHQKQEFLAQLQADYRLIVLSYFSKDKQLNQRIDEFVNAAFFCDISVTQIVEIHMDLMDELSKQLKLEGRSDEVLLDYRLTLIDVIAHLCEMYRRSIPRDS